MRKIIIDTDCGTDDAVALMMALSSQTKSKGIEIIGITCVGGNVLLDKVVKNVLSCIRVSNITTVPIYAGSEVALVSERRNASFWHGIDGLGDVLSKEEREQDNRFNKEYNIIKNTNGNGNPSVNFIIESIMSIEDIEIIALGPLTNIALALRMEPRIKQKLKKLHIMGGSVKGRGNITSTAEFNIYGDVEAAHICLKEIKDIILVDREAMLKNPVDCDFWEQNFENTFLGRVCAKSCKVSKKLYGNFPLPDALAMTTCLEPQSILKSEKRAMEVVLDSGGTRGMTIVHWRDEKPELHKVEIVEEVDIGIFEECLLRGIPN